MSKKRRKMLGEGDGSPLDMTSMIDVVFLLLIFFMCATKFKMPEGALRSYLPRNRGGAPSTPTLTKGCRVTLTTEAGRTLCMADDTLISNQYETDFERARGLAPGPSLDEVENHIQRRKDNYRGLAETGLPVIIDFAPNVPWKYVVDVLNICHRVGVEDISFAAPEIPID